MLTAVKKSDVRALYPQPDPESHKGQNGRVLIVGGSRDYYGAPILAGMGALFGGADLVTLMVPECNFDVARSYYPDFIVKAFPGDYLNASGVELISLASEGQGCLIMGPGLGDHPETLEAAGALVKKIKLPVVLDAQALGAFSRENIRGNNRILLTPHAHEFKTLFNEKLPSLLIERIHLVKKVVATFNVTVLLKGATDIIAGPNENGHCLNQTGNAGMTSGGTGDVLTGFAGSLMARGLSPYDAARVSAFLVGIAGDQLASNKGHTFTATDLALQLPYTIHSIIS